jgi:UDP-glucose 4-epimerase
MVPAKFLFISSLAAYGPGNPTTMEPVKLTDEPKPVEIYGRSKLEAEKYIRSLVEFPWLIFRPTGVYGPRETDYYVFFKTISQGLEPYIGTRKQILTFIYVRDLVRLVFDALESSFVRKAYFISDGQEYDSVTFAAITKKHLGKKTFSFTVPASLVKVLAVSLEKVYGLWGSTPTLNSDKYNVLSSTNWKCETGPLRTDFSFKALYDLDAGVKETLEWYKKEGWL